MVILEEGIVVAFIRGRDERESGIGGWGERRVGGNQNFFISFKSFFG